MESYTGLSINMCDVKSYSRQRLFRPIKSYRFVVCAFAFDVKTTLGEQGMIDSILLHCRWLPEESIH